MLQAVAVKNALPRASESSTGYCFIDLRLKRASLLTRCRSGREVEVVLVERKLIFGKEEEELFHDHDCDISSRSLPCTLDWAGAAIAASLANKKAKTL